MKILFILLTLFNLSIFAESPSTEEPNLKLDTDLVNEIYRSSLTEAQIDTKYSSGYFRVTAQLSSLNSASVNLQNNYFDVPYNDGFNGAPGVTVGLSRPLFNTIGFSLLAQTKVSYFNKTGTYTVYSKSGTPLRDSVTLHWLPVSAGGQVEYEFAHFPWIVPGFTASLGASYLYQLGRLDGINQGFWVPFYELTPQLTLFRRVLGAHWFGGLQISYSTLSAFGSDQILDSKRVSAGVEFLL